MILLEISHIWLATTRTRTGASNDRFRFDVLFIIVDQVLPYEKRRDFSLQEDVRRTDAVQDIGTIVQDPLEYVGHNTSG